MKMQITLPENIMGAIRAEAARCGITPNVLARMRLCALFLEDGADAGKKTYTFTVKDWREIEAYVEERKLGDVATFAAFAMNQYMSRNSLSEAQKRRVEKRHGISMDC